MKSIIHVRLMLVLMLFCSQTIMAQLSDLHYLPPLKQRTEAFTQQAIYLSTPETTPFTVNVYRGTATTPFTSYSISQATGATYDPGNGDNGITLLTDANTGSIQNTAGLRFEAPGGQKFYVNWRGRSASQGSSLTSKGRNALGTAFKWVGAPNRGTFVSALSNSMGVMATEDNTVINIFGYNPNTTFRLGATEGGITADELTITLNKGQTYVLEAPLNNTANQDGWLGASVTSNKPIAMNVGQMHYQPRSTASSRDAAIDQIIPENALGKEYIFIRGNGIDEMEFPVIIATQNDTKIYVNGSTSPIATINSGGYYMIPGTNYSESSATGSVPGANMHVRTSKEAYAVQSVAGSSNDATGDINFIAPVSCLLANKVDNIPDVSVIAGQTIAGGITILASSAIPDNAITVTYGGSTVSLATLTAAKKTVAGSSDWKTFFLPNLTGKVVVSATGPIAVGYFGASGVIGASGYFSGFETIPTIEVQRIGDGCLPSTILSATPGFTAYTWYRDGELVPNVKTSTYTPDKAGKFTVTVSNGSCSYHSANQYIYDCNPEIIVNTTADKNGILSGETVTFQVSVRYLSDVNVTNLVLTNLVPPNVMVTGTSATHGTVSSSGATYTWNIGTMRNGEEHILYITATGNTVTVPTPGTLTVSKTQTILGTESNKVPDDFTETVTVYSALTAEPTDRPTGLYFTNTGSAHPFNNVLHFTPAATANGYLVVRSTGAAEPSFVPVDGTSYSTGVVTGGEIIYIGSRTSVTDLFASASLNYHYAIYPYNGGGAATNYLTSTPLKAVINNRVFNNFAMPVSTKSSSAGIATEGVNVTFVNGVISGGTTVTATKMKDVRPTDYANGLPTGITSVKKLYYTVTSSAANPGEYVIVLDYSELGLTATQWTNVKVLKRSTTASPWTDITANVINFNTDGVLGKLVITGLTSFSEFAIGDQSTLPLTWGDFLAYEDNRGIILDWKTLQEQNTQDFIIQHSTNGNSWTNLGSLPAAGQSQSVLNYQFIHQAPQNGPNYYRIQQRDLDGQFSYSAVKKIQVTKTGSYLKILGNPVLNGILKFNASEAMTISVKTMDGRVLHTRKADAGINQVVLPQLAPGIYLLAGKNEVLKFVVR